MTTKPSGARMTAQESVTRSPALMLAMATVGFAVNFWAWALISPLGPLFRDQGHARAPSPSPTSRCWSRCRSSSARWAGSSSAR